MKLKFHFLDKFLRINEISVISNYSEYQFKTNVEGKYQNFSVTEFSRITKGITKEKLHRNETNVSIIIVIGLSAVLTSFLIIIIIILCIRYNILKNKRSKDYMPTHQVCQVNQVNQADKVDEIDQADQVDEIGQDYEVYETIHSVYDQEIGFQLSSLQQNPGGPYENQNPGSAHYITEVNEINSSRSLTGSKQDYLSRTLLTFYTHATIWDVKVCHTVVYRSSVRMILNKKFVREVAASKDPKCFEITFKLNDEVKPSYIKLPYPMAYKAFVQNHHLHEMYVAKCQADCSTVDSELERWVHWKMSVIHSKMYDNDEYSFEIKPYGKNYLKFRANYKTTHAPFFLPTEMNTKSRLELSTTGKFWLDKTIKLKNMETSKIYSCIYLLKQSNPYHECSLRSDLEWKIELSSLSKLIKNIEEIKISVGVTGSGTNSSQSLTFKKLAYLPTFSAFTNIGKIGIGEAEIYFKDSSKSFDISKISVISNYSEYQFKTNVEGKFQIFSVTEFSRITKEKLHRNETNVSIIIVIGLSAVLTSFLIIIIIILCIRYNILKNKRSKDYMPTHQVCQVNQVNQAVQVDEIDQADQVDEIGQDNVVYETLPEENIRCAVQNSESVYDQEIGLQLSSPQQNPGGPYENQDPGSAYYIMEVNEINSSRSLTGSKRDYLSRTLLTFYTHATIWDVKACHTVVYRTSVRMILNKVFVREVAASKDPKCFEITYKLNDEVKPSYIKLPYPQAYKAFVQNHHLHEMYVAKCQADCSTVDSELERWVHWNMSVIHSKTYDNYEYSFEIKPYDKNYLKFRANSKTTNAPFFLPTKMNTKSRLELSTTGKFWLDKTIKLKNMETFKIYSCIYLLKQSNPYHECSLRSDLEWKIELSSLSKLIQNIEEIKISVGVTGSGTNSSQSLTFKKLAYLPTFSAFTNIGKIGIGEAEIYFKDSNNSFDISKIVMTRIPTGEKYGCVNIHKTIPAKYSCKLLKKKIHCNETNFSVKIVIGLSAVLMSFLIIIIIILCIR
ncbi:Hypothetical predicted protein [Octopus vulgaris]|uniref:Uncharacterized protein n=1 Tax=Octopus vulgaris TaxID=6645 RepID=A0AA36BD57_OCTVU|nr:Hypothetical predicted protein [Octopus vulgaris]